MRFRTVRALALASVFALPAAAPLMAPSPAAARSAPDSFADLANQLLPAVVNISSASSVQARADRGGPDVPGVQPGSPFEQFFKDFLDRQHRGDAQPNRPGPGAPGRPEANGPRSVSVGSGFIIDPDGYIVTNNHVIDGADEITVTMGDNTTLKATLVGHDELADLALLKVSADHPLPHVEWGDSDAARIGDWVLAIGNPFNLGGTVTAGIVSARARNIHQGPYDDFIQTDAAINRGNSGGPLFNMDGRVIGINTAIYSPSGGSVGIGFSVPANQAKNVINQLREFGRAKRGWLGVSIQQVTPDIAEGFGRHTSDGALVGRLNDGGPAEKSGIKTGDIILKFNGQDVKEMAALPRIVASTPIGQNVPVVLWRDGKEVTIQASIGELPDDVQQASATPSCPAAPPTRTAAISGLGVTVSPMTDDLRGKFSLRPEQKGVVVTDVEDGGAAASRGLKAGDVIVEVQQEAVANPSDVQERVDRFRKQNRRSVLMLVQSGDGLRWIPLPLEPPSGRAPG